MGFMEKIFYYDSEIFRKKSVVTEIFSWKEKISRFFFRSAAKDKMVYGAPAQTAGAENCVAERYDSPSVLPAVEPRAQSSVGFTAPWKGKGPEKSVRTGIWPK